MLNKAVEWGKLRAAPRFKKLKAELPEIDFLGADELARLLSAAQGEPEWHAAIIVALNTGMRLGELLALEWRDIDLDGRRVVVSRSDWQGHVGTPKGGKTRTIPLNANAVAALTAIKHNRGARVWCQPDGEPHTKDHFGAALRRIRKRGGLRPFQWHRLRHSFASCLVMRGVTLKVVQELMGHTSIEMTLRYAHLAPQAAQSAVDVLVDPTDAPAAP